jgi:hypothetical protein
MSSLIDSKHQELSQDEIIAIAAKETGSKYSAEQIKASLLAEAHEMGAIMMREGNTIFIVHRSPERPDVALFRALNADTVANYLKNSMVFTKAVGLAGFKYLVTTFEEPSLLNIFRYVKRNAPFSGMGYAVQKSKDGTKFRVTINLGQANAGGLPDKAMPQAPGAI